MFKRIRLQKKILNSRFLTKRTKELLLKWLLKQPCDYLTRLHLNKLMLEYSVMILTEENIEDCKPFNNKIRKLGKKR